MKNTFRILLITFSIGLATLCSAQDYSNGIGVRLGTYFAGTYKTFLNETAAVEGVAGISRIGGQSLLTLGGYYQRHHGFTSDIPTLRWYYGGGAQVSLGNSDIDSNISIAAVIGLEYTLVDTPVAIFIDAFPFYSINNGTGFDTEASLGVRYVMGRE